MRELQAELRERSSIESLTIHGCGRVIIAKVTSGGAAEYCVELTEDVTKSLVKHGFICSGTCNPLTRGRGVVYMGIGVRTYWRHENWHDYPEGAEDQTGRTPAILISGDCGCARVYEGAVGEDQAAFRVQVAATLREQGQHLARPIRVLPAGKYQNAWNGALIRTLVADGRFEVLGGGPDLGTAGMQAAWNDVAIVESTLPEEFGGEPTEETALELIRQLVEAGCPAVGWYPGTDEVPEGLRERMMAAGCVAFWSGQEFPGLLELAVTHSGVFTADPV